VEATEPVTVLDAVDVPVPEVELESDDGSDEDVPDEDVPDEVPLLELPCTGARAEDCPPAAAWDDVDVW
jgi:hypothetical protein